VRLVPHHRPRTGRRTPAGPAGAWKKRMACSRHKCATQGRAPAEGRDPLLLGSSSRSLTKSATRSLSNTLSQVPMYRLQPPKLLTGRPGRAAGMHWPPAHGVLGKRWFYPLSPDADRRHEPCSRASPYAPGTDSPATPVPRGAVTRSAADATSGCSIPSSSPLSCRPPLPPVPPLRERGLRPRGPPATCGRRTARE
jgi:hypothetical protein